MFTLMVFLFVSGNSFSMEIFQVLRDVKGNLELI